MKDGQTAGRQDGTLRAVRRTMIAALALAVLPSCRLAALQCPDGAPPPCAGTPRAAVPPANSVAVLYFESRSGDTNDLALADGLTEEIISRLSGIERLTVRSRYLVRRLRGAALEDPAAAGRNLNVTYLVSGTVRRSGGRLRVNAELIRAAGGAQVWGQQFDQASGDVFAVQEEVARDVATGIVGRLLPAETRTLAVRPTASAEAYDAYTLGRLYWNKRTAPDLVRASQYFQQAIRADSSYAQAWSGLADSYVLFIPQEYDVPGINPDSILTLAEAAARRAIALAPRLGEAYASLGEILDYRNRRDEAGRAFEQGVALSPRYPTAHQWYSYHLLGLGRWNDGLREMERAKELDPTSLVIVTSLVFAYDGAERWAEAEAMADVSRALDRDHPLTVLFADFLHDAGHRHLERVPSDIRRIAQSGAWLAPAWGGDTVAAADVARRLGDPAQRAAAIREIAARSPLFGLALRLAYDGDEATIAYLDGLGGTPPGAGLPDWMAYGMLGPRRRAEPRFVAALARLGISRP
jgi:TolB-like protein/Tfp pilus assembly protein PilF